MNLFCPECGQLSMHADPNWFGLFLEGVRILGHRDGGPETPCWDCYLIANPIEYSQSQGSVFDEDGL